MLKHRKTSAIADTADATLVQPTDWNNTHGHDAGSFVTVGWVKFKAAAGSVSGGDGWPNNFPTALTRVAAGHWTFEAPKIFYEDDHLLPGHGLDYRPTMAIAPRGALTAGFYITVYASDTTIHVECWNSSDAYVDPNVAVDITVTMHAHVIAV